MVRASTVGGCKSDGVPDQVGEDSEYEVGITLLMDLEFIRRR